MSKYKFKINYTHANSYIKKEQYFLSILEYSKIYLKIFCCMSLCTAKMLLAKTSKFCHRDQSSIITAHSCIM